MSNKIIAFQGVEGANSHLACRKFCPDFETKNYASFADVFDAVDKGEVDYGMIPLENSYAGRVAEIHNLLQNYEVSVIAEHFFAVEHQLAVKKSAKIDNITKVYSHPQALMQCSKNLRKIDSIKQAFDKGEQVMNEMSNTAAAAQYIAEKGQENEAVICSKYAAEKYGLQIIKENIQDDKNNFTIFVRISKEPQDADPSIAPVVTSLIFTIRNISGSLYKALGGFATNAVPMIKIESYIPSGSSRQANFFISIEGHPSQRNVALALEELGFFSKSVKVVGIYYADEKRALSK